MDGLERRPIQRRMRKPEMSPEPFFSVVIPTYKRPDLLPRAVESVRRQTCPDWEIIVSDDEPVEGETWKLMLQLAAKDSRIRITRNPGPAHGQTPNVNHAFSMARGRWIKPLWDDDELLDECLACFRAGIEARPDVVFVTCDCQRISSLPAPDAPETPARVVAYCSDSLQTLLAYYRQEPVGGGTPTRVAVLRRVVAEGVAFEEPPGITTTVDLLWFTRIAGKGQSLWMPVVLVREYQTGHVSVTSAVSDRSLDEQFALLRSIQHDMLPAALRSPSLPVSLQALRLLRAAQRLKDGRRREAVSLAASVWNPGAWLVFLRCLIQRRHPFMFTRVARTRLNVALPTPIRPHTCAP